jgi:maltose/moltooligosaccharide transporter
VISTKEYSPDEMRSFSDAAEVEGPSPTIRALAARGLGVSGLWIAAGLAVLLIVGQFGLEKEMYLLGGLLIAYGLASVVGIYLARQGRSSNMLANIVGDFSGMPEVMKRLAVAQFFSWSALFIMWINTTPVVARNFYNSPDPASAGFQEAGNWVGVLFAVYNGVAAIAALTLLPYLARRIGKAKTHIVGLLCGAAGYASFFLFKDPQHLLIAEIGVGIAWASILAMPYAILASNLPQAKLGIYMGLFNVFIVVPQLLVATVMGSIMKAWFPDQPIYTMAFAAGTLVLAALAMLRVKAAEASD